MFTFIFKLISCSQLVNKHSIFTRKKTKPKRKKNVQFKVMFVGFYCFLCFRMVWLQTQPAEFWGTRTRSINSLSYFENSMLRLVNKTVNCTANPPYLACEHQFIATLQVPHFKWHFPAYWVLFQLHQRSEPCCKQCTAHCSVSNGTAERERSSQPE